MRVLEINAVYGYGSTGTIVRDLQNYCEENGIECYVAFAQSDGPVNNGYKIGSLIENRLHAVLCRIAGKQAYFSVFATWRLLRFMDRIRPDVVHLHNLHSNYIHLNMLLRFLAKNDIRTVISLHDCWWFTGGCFHYTAAGCDKWLSGCGHCPKRYVDTPAYIWDASKQVLKDRMKYLSSIPRLTIVGVSDWIANEARKSFLNSKTILTIHNGIDLSVFKPTPSDLRKSLGLEGKYVILGPASKWLDPINAEVLQYFEANMASNMVLLLFGVAGDIGIDLPENVILYGYTTNREKLAALYTMADVFVNPSREESMGLINIEAQACGTPVVAFEGTGVSETVSHDCLVKTGDYSSLFHTCLSIGKDHSPVLYSHLDQCSAYVAIYENERDSIN